jgi:hypothetical protein
MASEQWTDADEALAARAITATWSERTPLAYARAVLDALTAAGWQPIHRAVDFRIHGVGAVNPADVTIVYRTAGGPVDTP